VVWCAYCVDHLSDIDWLPSDDEDTQSIHDDNDDDNNDNGLVMSAGNDEAVSIDVQDSPVVVSAAARSGRRLSQLSNAFLSQQSVPSQVCSSCAVLDW